jgi:hypothetical protein
MVLLKFDPRFDSLRDDARLLDLVRLMSFPEPTRTMGRTSFGSRSDQGSRPDVSYDG